MINGNIYMKITYLLGRLIVRSKRPSASAELRYVSAVKVQGAAKAKSLLIKIPELLK